MYPELYAFNSGPDNGINDVSLVSNKKQFGQVKPSNDKEFQPLKPENIVSNEAEITKENRNSIANKHANDDDQNNAGDPCHRKAKSEKNIFNECCDSFIKSGDLFLLFVYAECSSFFEKFNLEVTSV